MTIDNSKLNYYSGWDIDQVFLPTPIPLTLSIGASPNPDVTAATASSLYIHDLGYLPVIEAQYQAAGMNTWHQCGLPDGFIMANWDTSAFGGVPSYYPGLIQTNGVAVTYGFDTQNIYFNAINYSNNAQTIAIRLYIWADKIDY